MFAIAITLLVIEIGVPHLKGEPDGTTLLGDHHTRFRFIERSNHILLFLNTLFLMCVAFIPFPTALLAEYIEETDAERTTAVAVYSAP